MAQNDNGSMSRESPAPDGGDSARDQAIRQLERKRRFHAEAIGWTIVMVVLVVVWAMSEYHNAGGWPTEGLSQSSGIHHVWNYWILYPFIAYLLFLGLRAWSLYGHKPISEADIKREMDRQSKAARSS
jgi:2TM domain